MQEWHIIGRGLAGWHAKGINVSSKGGDINPYTYWTGEKVCGYAAEAIEGCLVYDADAVRNDKAACEEFIKLVISGPIVNPEITVDQGTTALSYITVATFETMLRKIPGVKVGHIRNGIVIWS